MFSWLDTKLAMAAATMLACRQTLLSSCDSASPVSNPLLTHGAAA